MPNAEPAFAEVELLCDVAKLVALRAIPNFVLQSRPMRTPDPAVARISALADEDAQKAARALGCTVTITQSAEAYRKQIENLYRSVKRDTPPDGKHH